MNLNDLLKSKSKPIQPLPTKTIEETKKSISSFKMRIPGATASAGVAGAPKVAINQAQAKSVPAEFAVKSDEDIFAGMDEAFDSAAVNTETNDSLIDTTNVSNYHYAQQAEAADDTVCQTFYYQMHELVNGFNRPEISKQMVNILQHLKDNPDLKAIIKPEDIGHMVRALRESYGIAFTNKAAAKSKSGERKKVDNAVLDELSSLGF